MLNGGLREAVLVPAFGNPAGLVLSGVLLCAWILLVAFLLTRWIGGRAWVVGVLWLGLTLAFEFGFGHLVRQRSWGELLSAYTFEGGNLWPIVLLVTLLAPALASRRAGA